MFTTNRQLRGREESWPVTTLDFPAFALREWKTLCRDSKWLPTANGIGFGELTPYLFYHKRHHCVHIASYRFFFTYICACALSVCVTQVTAGRHKYGSVRSSDRGDSRSNQKGYKDETEELTAAYGETTLTLIVLMWRIG